MKKIVLTLLAGAAIVMIFFAGPANGYPSNYIAVLNSAQTVPITASGAKGFCRASMVDSDFQWGEHLQVICDFTGLSGGLVGAEILEAYPGQNGSNPCSNFWGSVSLPNNGSGRMTLGCSNSGYPMPYDYFDIALAYEKRLSVVLKTVNFPDGEIRGQIKPVTLDLDVNGEGRSEMSLVRPGDGTAYSYCGLTNGAIVKPLNWQAGIDSTPFLADFDGDGISDWTFIRTGTSGALIWMSQNSIDSQTTALGFGLATLGDIPVYGDYTGDGRSDMGIFRSTTGQWFVIGLYWGQTWGQAGDKPCTGDYDGDGTADLCRISSEAGQLVWHVRRSSDRQEPRIPWGLESDTLFPNDPVDIDGDGINDPLVARLENGHRVFYGLRSSDQSLYVLQWGLTGDTAKLGDYDGDAKTDFASIRETDGHLVWYINQSSNGAMRVQQWGLPGDK